ncbi:MAG: GNAT family N-acetyltransferase [Gammaproteobacteria bacterium RIFOXYB2_FULL_38_6]|nr:MAG: GNAT family N-acetyltransferase [Gammaproteobacteria bacterium RIFOXYB2_FULL_38_6]
MTADIYQKPFPVIELDSQYYLREQLPKDAEDFFNYYRDPEVNQYILTTAPKDLNDARSEINYCNNLFKHKRGIYWTIARKSDDRMIGAIGLYINSFHRRAEISYDLARAFWRQGIMSKAIQKVIDLAFNDMQLNRVEAITMVENEASISILKKHGFQYEGRLRHYKFHQDRPYDVEMFGLIRKQ